MTRHQELVREVLAACNRLPGVFLFPVDVARVPGWKRTLGSVGTSDISVGTSDILGWKEYPLICEHGKAARFVAFEVKVGRDELRPGQRWFLDKVKASGGIALEIRDIMTAVEALK